MSGRLYFQDNSANSSKKVSFKSWSLLSPGSEQEGKTDSTRDSVSRNPASSVKGKESSSPIGLVQDKDLPDSATAGYYFHDNSAKSSKRVSFKSSSPLSPASEHEGKTDSTHDSVSPQETLPDLLATSYSTKDFADAEQNSASLSRSSSLLNPGP